MRRKNKSEFVEIRHLDDDEQTRGREMYVKTICPRKNEQLSTHHNVCNAGFVNFFLWTIV